jgi:excisionase family DNA binding protein
MDNLISVTEAASILGVSTVRIRQMITEGVIKSARKIGRNYVIRLDEIEKLHKRRVAKEQTA